VPTWYRQWQNYLQVALGLVMVVGSTMCVLEQYSTARINCVLLVVAPYSVHSSSWASGHKEHRDVRTCIYICTVCSTLHLSRCLAVGYWDAAEVNDACV
jgi:hypothetical protein